MAWYLLPGGEPLFPGPSDKLVLVALSGLGNIPLDGGTGTQWDEGIILGQQPHLKIAPSLQHTTRSKESLQETPPHQTDQHYPPMSLKSVLHPRTSTDSLPGGRSWWT